MELAGTILHKASSGRLIIKAKTELSPGKVLLDSTGKKIAKIIELLGPVSSPYASAIPLTEEAPRSTGKSVYSGQVTRNVGRGRD